MGDDVTREERRLAAIVSADVVGYSRLMGRDESGTLAALRSIRRELVDPKIAAHGGRIVKTTGDGLLLEFPSVVDAVRCAVEVQGAMADRNADVADDRRIAFRIGINLGDVIVEDGDIFGDGVNIAARVQEICQARRHQPVAPGARGDSGPARYRASRWRRAAAQEHRPPAPHLVLARSGGTRARSGADRSRPAGATFELPDKPSVAVLPFTNMSGDPQQEYFADGIVEDIITELSRFRSLFVIARN